MIEALKVVLVIYCLALALLAPLGLHRFLLVYPARAIYSLFGLALLLFSFGRIKAETPLMSIWRRGKRSRRSLRSSFRDWRREKEEEKIIWSSAESGENPLGFLKDAEK